MHDLNAMEIATEKARRKTAEARLELTLLVSQVARRRRQARARANFLREQDALLSDSDSVDNASLRRRRFRSFVVGDLESVMKSTVESLREIGLMMIPVYVSTLQADFELRSVWRSIELSMDEAFAEVEKQATARLGSSGKTVNRTLDKAKKELARTKIDVYRELQIESHNLRSKIARRIAPNREDRHTKTKIPEVSFMQQAVLRDFAARMAEEASQCFDARAYTAAAIMAGSAMEAILLDALQHHSVAASENDLAERPLSDLLHLALKSGLIGQSTTKLTDWVRENRNLLHPGRVLRQKKTVEREESEMCLSILKLICKEARARLGSNSSQVARGDA